jgi:hypothetical protein
MTRAFTFIAVILLTTISAIAQPHTYTNVHRQLHNEFDIWKKQQLENRIFQSVENCNREWYVSHPESEAPIWGFPELKDCSFFYADLNNDGMEDQLVSFNPVQCDGGNASMWMQVNVLTISENGRYVTSSDWDEALFPQLKRKEEGFCWFTGIADGTIEAIHYVLQDTDPRCCPSVRILTVFDYSTGTILREEEIPATKEK